MDSRLNLIMCLTILFLSLNGCNRNTRDAFSFERQKYIGDELKTSGYYSYEEGGIYSYIFLFNNGVTLSASASNGIDSQEELNTHLMSYNFSQLSSLPYYWGIFEVNQGRIYFEQWISADARSYPILKKEGIILSDSSFTITRKKIEHNNTDQEVEEIYQFKHFRSKPDSISLFIN